MSLIVCGLVYEGETVDPASIRAGDRILDEEGVPALVASVSVTTPGIFGSASVAITTADGDVIDAGPGDRIRRLA